MSRIRTYAPSIYPYVEGMIKGTYQTTGTVKTNSQTYFVCKCVKCGSDDHRMPPATFYKPVRMCSTCKQQTLRRKKFGHLEVIWSAGSDGKNRLWRCHCVCGDYNVIVPANKLINGKVTSCGCMDVSKIKYVYNGMSRYFWSKFLRSAIQRKREVIITT